MSWWISPRELRRRGVVGMNERNGDFIAVHNPRHLYPRVDNKLLTKQLAREAGVAVPALYGRIETHRDIRSLRELLAGQRAFVIKPVQGSGGNGIVVIDDRIDADTFRRANGHLVRREALEHHIGNILSGAYSLGGQPDVAMIEERIQFSQVFRDISYQGAPDIRIIVYRGCPAMAMIRLPTRQSDGKANLHQGAVGAGIELEDGCTTAGVWFNTPIAQHPDTQCAIAGHEIPQWREQLQLAARAYEVAPLGYLGVDIILDAQRGPLLLELNARPGLAIQMANQAGLRWRLRAIDHWLAAHGERQPDAEARSTWFAQVGLVGLAEAAAARG